MSDIKLLGSFMTDFWQFLKKYHDSASDWNELITEANALGDKHKGRLQWNLINAFLDYLDGKEYEMRKG